MVILLLSDLGGASRSGSVAGTTAAESPLASGVDAAVCIAGGGDRLCETRASVLSAALGAGPSECTENGDVGASEEARASVSSMGDEQVKGRSSAAIAV